MSEKKKFYNIQHLLEEGASYNLLLGERSNGKSYATKYAMLWEAYNEADYLEYLHTNKVIEKKRHQLGYIRRWREEIKTRDVEQYFSDMPIKDITRQEYDCVVCFRSDIYFGKTDNEGKIERGKPIGSTFALTSATHYKSLAFPLIGNIVFEEFLTNAGYLPHEVDNLQDIISTIARRDYVRIFMIGNTVSRNCPYFDEWQLINVKKQKQGTIDIYRQHTNQVDENTGKEITIDIAVEYCSNDASNSKMFFGQKSKMITSGVWECDAHPHLELNFNEYKCKYKVLYKYKSFGFMLCLLIDPNNKQPFVYVYPSDNTHGIKRIVTDEFCTDKFATNYLTPLTKLDKILIELIGKQKVCFSDNLTGTEFYQVKKERGGL